MENTLPKNWVETTLGNISQIIRGVSYNKNQAFSEHFDSSTYVLRGGNIQDGKIIFFTDDNVFVESCLINDIQNIKKNDVVIVGSTGSKKLIGKAGIADEDLDNVSFGAFLMLLRTKVINRKFHSYFFLSKYYRNSISESAGGVNINNIRKEHLEHLTFPLPPLPEQERIVAKLDALFLAHENIKKSLQRIPLILKDFRQQVLTQAVTGKLTEQWREGKKLEEWKVEKLNNVCFSFKYGSSSKSDDLGQIAVIRMGNLQHGKIDYSDLKFSNNKNEISKYLLSKDDVLFNRTNSPELVGKTSIYKGQLPAIYAGYLIKIENDKTKLNSDYLNFYMNSHYVKKWCNEVKTDGVSQSNINAQKLALLKIPIPPLPEQQEIVSRVESLFAKADAIENRYKSLKEKVEQLPQSILHKAFKGELVPQLPTDGDAKELLAEILKLKAETAGKKKTSHKK